MIRVIVELVPHGDESRAKVIGEMVIANDCTGTPEEGNYLAVIAPDNWTTTYLQHSKLKGFPRTCSVWELIEALLQGKQNNPMPEGSLYQRLKTKLKSLKEKSNVNK